MRLNVREGTIAGADGEARHFGIEGCAISAIGAQFQSLTSQLMLDTGSVLFVVFILGKENAPSWRLTKHIG